MYQHHTNDDISIIMMMTAKCSSHTSIYDCNRVPSSSSPILPITADRAAHVCGIAADDDDDTVDGDEAATAAAAASVALLPIDANRLFDAAGVADDTGKLARRFHIHWTTRTVFNPLPL